MPDLETPFEDITEASVMDVLRERGNTIPADEVVVDETPTEDEPVVPDETETEDVENDEELEPLIPVAEAPVQVDAWDFDGERLSRDELERLVSFQKLLTSNPAVYQAVSQAIDQALTPTTQTPVPVLPDGFDADDPIVQWTQNQLQEMQQRLDQAETAAAQVQESQELQQRAAAQGLIGRAKKSFGQQNQLETGIVDQLYERAANTINIPGLLQSPVDPRDGKPWRPDALSVLEAALDMTYLATPEGRQRDYARLSEQQTKAAERKAKLSALGGQKGTVPQAPQLPDDPRMAAIAVATEMMTGGLPE